MTPTEPLALHHSWPLTDSRQQFRDGALLPPRAAGLMLSREKGDMLVDHGVGVWTCTIPDDAMNWNDAMYDILGFPQGAAVTRAEALAVYAEESRAATERLRAHAIRHRRGFTIDVEMHPAAALPRWMRLVASPVIVDGRVERLEGLKLPIDPPTRR